MPSLPRSDPWWSHTQWCPSWQYNKYFTQWLGAKRSMFLSGTSLFFLPIGAGIGDKTGRKPMFFFGLIMRCAPPLTFSAAPATPRRAALTGWPRRVSRSAKSILCNLLSTLPWFIRQDPQAYLLYASGLLSGLGAGAGPLSFAMMVDIIPGDMREQGFPVM